MLCTFWTFTPSRSALESTTKWVTSMNGLCPDNGLQRAIAARAAYLAQQARNIVCPGDKVWRNMACRCPSGQTDVGLNRCEHPNLSCPAGTYRQPNGTCVSTCPSNQVMDHAGNCVTRACEPGYVRQNNICVRPACPAGQSRDSSGICREPQTPSTPVNPPIVPHNDPPFVPPGSCSSGGPNEPAICHE